MLEESPYQDQEVRESGYACFGTFPAFGRIEIHDHCSCIICVGDHHESDYYRDSICDGECKEAQGKKSRVQGQVDSCMILYHAILKSESRTILRRVFHCKIRRIREMKGARFLKWKSTSVFSLQSFVTHGCIFEQNQAMPKLGRRKFLRTRSQKERTRSKLTFCRTFRQCQRK